MNYLKKSISVRMMMVSFKTGIEQCRACEHLEEEKEEELGSYFGIKCKKTRTESRSGKDYYPCPNYIPKCPKPTGKPGDCQNCKHTQGNKPYFENDHWELQCSIECKYDDSPRSITHIDTNEVFIHINCNFESRDPNWYPLPFIDWNEHNNDCRKCKNFVQGSEQFGEKSGYENIWFGECTKGPDGRITGRDGKTGINCSYFDPIQRNQPVPPNIPIEKFDCRKCVHCTNPTLKYDKNLECWFVECNKINNYPSICNKDGTNIYNYRSCCYEEKLITDEDKDRIISELKIDLDEQRKETEKFKKDNFELKKAIAEQINIRIEKSNYLNELNSNLVNENTELRKKINELCEKKPKKLKKSDYEEPSIKQLEKEKKKLEKIKQKKLNIQIRFARKIIDNYNWYVGCNEVISNLDRWKVIKMYPKTNFEIGNILLFKVDNHGIIEFGERELDDHLVQEFKQSCKDYYRERLEKEIKELKG